MYDSGLNLSCDPVPEVSGSEESAAYCGFGFVCIFKLLLTLPPCPCSNTTLWIWRQKRKFLLIVPCSRNLREIRLSFFYEVFKGLKLRIIPSIKWNPGLSKFTLIRITICGKRSFSTRSLLHIQTLETEQHFSVKRNVFRISFAL